MVSYKGERGETTGGQGRNDYNDGYRGYADDTTVPQQDSETNTKTEGRSCR